MMSTHIREIVEIFPDLVHLARGDKQTRISDMQAPESASQQSLIFVATPQIMRLARNSPAQAWVVAKDLLGQVPEHVPVVLVSANPQLAMALIAKRFFRPTAHHQIIMGSSTIHPQAHVASSALVGADCVIGPGAVVGEGCVVGEKCVIGANAVLEPGVKVGPRTHIHPLVFIGYNCEIGADCEIHPHTTIGSEGFGYAQDEKFNHHRITHFGKVVLEDRVHVGAGVQIDRGTYLDSRIGEGTKIDNHCHFGHNIQIGRNTLITGGMITAGSVKIGSYCVFGGRTTISGHLEIADKVQVSGLSGVSKGIPQSGEYGGFPLQDLKSSIRTRASLKDVPYLSKQVKRILKHLGLETQEANVE